LSRRLPAIKPERLARALRRLGFQVETGKGSHFHAWHPETRRSSTLVLGHQKEIGHILLTKILKSLDVDQEIFRREI